jgi:pimeloyl-ACP methyl ester carboxylesterase
MWRATVVDLGRHAYLKDVRAVLCKLLDWGTIQMARRCTKPRGKTIDDPPHLLTHATKSFSFRTPARAENFTWDPLGAFQFPSPVQTPAAVNNTVFGKFFPASDKWTKHPTTILLHGWNAELCYRHLFPQLAARLRRAGLNTACMELPYHMQRRPVTGPVTDFISPHLARMLEATRQALADTQALASWLRDQGSPAVGVWGFSLGAWLAGLLTRTADELRFAVLTTPIARLDRVIMELPFCEPVRRSLQRQPVDLSFLNLATEKPVIQPSRILLVQSRHDLFAPAETVEELWRAWNRPEIWRLPHGHISVLFSKPVMDRTVEWIARQSRALSP